ncbi:MAG: c-type cytochrome [Sphingomonadales bacterium]|nr:c-type cytochrome [Sphingomonadales bacterium]
MIFAGGVLAAGIALAGAGAAAPVGNAAAGASLFDQRCKVCHVIGEGQKGVLAPNLRGVVGRRAASTAFAYSPALKASGLTWTPAHLSQFLTAPMKMVPGTRMVVSIPDPHQRADVIAYLATLK